VKGCAILVTDIWHNTSFAFLILLGALQMLPREPFEAAVVDGATFWQRFRYVTLPLMKPAILVVLLFRTVFAIRLFDEVWVLTRGGPNGSTETISLLLFRSAFEFFEVGEAGALSIIPAKTHRRRHDRRGREGLKNSLETDMTKHHTDTVALQREARMMNLEALIHDRETVEIIDLPIATPDLLARYERLYTGAISDVLREHCLLDQALPPDLVPLRPERTVAGIAFTVKSAPNTKITGELTFRTQMLIDMPADSFVVWDTSGDMDSTAWGGVMTATAIGKGIRAAVIDGGIRDTNQILEKDFPVFYKYRSPNGSLGRCLISHYQQPIKMGNTLVRPGDIVVGDIDGVIVVPRGIAVAVLERSEEILRNEAEIFKWVASGDTLEEITGRGGYF